MVKQRWWLFSPRTDVAVFVGSALLAMLALAVGYELGFLHQDTPDWTWIYAVLLVDVAHVWSTGFRVYFDLEEVRRRPVLYVLTPILAWLVGVLLYSLGELTFWRVLAYLAVWHFVRQQYGWVMLYRARLQETRWRWLDAATIYATTLYPLLWWHAHLPRQFWWFLPGDFARVPAELVTVAGPLYWGLLAAYTFKSLAGWTSGQGNPGKDMVVYSTAVCWYVGIVALNSDYAFTVTNVLIHGIPYMALIWFYARRKGGGTRLGVAPFLLTLWLLAYCEEMFWDRAIWHERSWLFGGKWEVPGLHALLVPLLAVPQITHYVLDGFIWRRKANPEMERVV